MLDEREELNDEELVERWRAAETDEEREEVFYLLFSRHRRQVVAFFTRWRLSPDVAEDLAQEAFLRVYKSLAQFRGDSSFGTWLFLIATNLYKNTLRERATQKREGKECSLDARVESGLEALPEMQCPEEEPLMSLLAEERKRVLRAAIEKLPAQMRRCVLLRVQDGLRYREIADLMRISIDTVKAHLFQARQRLKLELGDYFAELDFQ